MTAYAIASPHGVAHAITCKATIPQIKFIHGANTALATVNPWKHATNSLITDLAAIDITTPSSTLLQIFAHYIKFTHIHTHIHTLRITQKKHNPLFLFLTFYEKSYLFIPECAAVLH